MQNYKGDDLELKMEAVGATPLSLTEVALDEFYAGAYECSPFLLMLYDEKRIPFWNRIKRNVFVDFIKQALVNFPVTGTFEAYLFVLRQIFGEDTEIIFDVPFPGKLAIAVNVSASLEFEFIAREFVSGAYVYYNVVDYDDNFIVFRGIPGIDNEYDLKLLFSELMPIGITPDVSLTFYSFFSFITDPDEDFVVTEDDDNIIFREIGG